MKDEAKTKEQLISELAELRQQTTAQLETLKTKHKKVEEVLQEAEKRYRSILDGMMEGCQIINSDWRYVYVNDAVASHGRYSKDELLGHTMMDMYPGIEDTEMFAQLRQCMEKRTPHRMENEFTYPNGAKSWFELSIEPAAEGILVLSTDITEHKQAEEVLRQSEERYRTILEEMEDGYYEVDLAGNYTFFNDATCRAYGYSRDEMMGMNYRAYTSEEDAKKVFKAFNQVYRTGKPLDSRSREIFRKDGSRRFLENSASPMRDQEGKIIGFRGVGRDITERKQMEEALRQSEERYRTILEEMEDGYYEVDLAGNFTFFNDAECRQLGYSREEMMGMNYRVYTPKEETERVYKAYNQIYRTGESNKGFTFEVVRKDGGTGFGELAAFPLRNQEGKIIGFRGVSRDITERKRMEEERKELEQKAQLASRLATVGEMASGIAHEINNPLTGVIGYAQLLLAKKDLPEDIKKELSIINDGGQRVAGIVSKLLTFARQHKPQRDYVSINDLIANTLDLRAYELKSSNIKVITHLDPELPGTIADGGQLQQVFLNLIVNAETEMKLAHGKGKLSVKTERMDNTIRISFKDDGPGIAKENIDKIFNPFFTTREVGEGTGLGLSMCHGIIAEHNGRIYAESKLGKGATFVVELPVVTETEQSELADPVVEETKVALKEKILVVDDEPTVLLLVSRVLTDEGHEVETIDNADDALETIEHKRYSLILLDIKMPGMSGIELYKRIQKIAPSLARRIVFITGDVIGASTTAFIVRTKVHCIMKPFDAEQLKRAVNRILTA